MLSALGAKEEWLEIRQSGAECSVGVAKPETLVFATVSLRDAVETAVLKQFLYKAVFEGIFEAVKSFAWRVCEQTSPLTRKTSKTRRCVFSSSSLSSPSPR